MSNFFGDTTLTFLGRGLDVHLRRQAVLSSNVANLDTPGYKAKDVDFSRALDRARPSTVGLRRTSSGHITPDGLESSNVPTREVADRAPSPNGNTVDLDAQMSRIGQNAIAYQASTRAVSKKLALLKYAATEGGY